MKNSQNFAPVVIIAYNRPYHTLETIKSLCNNKESNFTNLYVFIDGHKTSEDFKKQKIIIKNLNDFSQYFKSIKIKVRKKNLGLAKNVIYSVTSVIKYYKKIIVLEDDIVVSNSFLKFMNDALSYYLNNKNIWHIAAHTEINDLNKPNDTFLWRMMNCWGWGTWKDRWEYFEKNTDELIETFTKKQIREFDLNNTGMFWHQIIDNHLGKRNTWAIYWYVTIFKNKGLCLNPWFSYAKNIGFDGTGINSPKDKKKILDQPLNHYGIFQPIYLIKEDNSVLKKMSLYYSRPLLEKLKKKMEIIIFVKLYKILKKS